MNIHVNALPKGRFQQAFRRAVSLTLILCGSVMTGSGQAILNFPLNDINSLIQNGTCEVTHSTFDIGSIQDVFDHNNGTLARSANINPMVITLTFPFEVRFSSASVIQAAGDGWWTMEAANSISELDTQTGSYVLLVSMSTTHDGVMMLKDFPQVSRSIIRLTVRRITGDDYVHLTEWQLPGAAAEVSIENVCMRPSQIWLLANTSLDLYVTGEDADGHPYPIQSGISWQVPDADIATLVAGNEYATVSAEDTVGSTTCTVSWKTFQYSTTVHVANTFVPLVAPMQKVKVALVIIDPPIAAENGLRFHERFGWDDPHHLANALRDSLNSAGGGAVDYDITSIIDDTTLYASFQGVVISIDSMYRLFLEPGWPTFHALEQLGNAFFFDYNGLLAAHDFCSLSDAGEIDEVWVYSMPFTGMYESRLTGQEAFWYNSPPLDGNPCVGQLPIMGFNYERGVAEAMHSFGHRVESAMAHTFGRWDYNAPEKNDWEKFSSYDKVAPGEAHCGNIHFPPNAVSDYDYGNTGFVETKAENWKRYPFLFNFSSSTDCQAWECSQLGFMSWWYHHLPHFTCKNSSGILNNWWPYIVDYPDGKALEKSAVNCNCDFVESSSAIVPVSALPAMIYPNPGNGMVFLKAAGMKGIENITAVDLFGRVVSVTVTSLSDSRIQIGTAGIPDGLYFLILPDAFSHQRIIPFTIVHP